MSTTWCQQNSCHQFQILNKLNIIKWTWMESEFGRSYDRGKIVHAYWPVPRTSRTSWLNHDSNQMIRNSANRKKRKFKAVMFRVPSKPKIKFQENDGKRLILFYRIDFDRRNSRKKFRTSFDQLGGLHGIWKLKIG